jgi:hypothetical protein
MGHFNISPEFARNLLESLEEEKAPPNPYSPKKFAPAQLLTLIYLKDLANCAADIETSKTPSERQMSLLKYVRSGISGTGCMSYRDLIRTLRKSPETVRALRLKMIPHHSTLFFAERRFKTQNFGHLE